MIVKVLIADDHVIVRDGIKALLQQQHGFEVVGVAGDGRSVMKLVAKHNPEIVIMDVAMPEMNGMEATRKLASDHPEVKVIALSMHSDRLFVSEMLKSGARGYLLKDCAYDELIDAINMVVRGQIYLSPQITNVVIEEYISKVSHAEKKVPKAKLTAREREVLQLLAEGKNAREIASVLHRSIKTVESHRLNIMEKLNIHTIAGLTKYAIREGITFLDK